MILYIDHQVPRPDEDAGSLRASGMLRILRMLGYKVALSAEDDSPRRHHLQRLAELDIEVIPLPQLAERLGGESLRPDLVIVARTNVAVAVMPILRAHVPGVPVVFDTVDLHHRRAAREAALQREAGASLRALAVKAEELAIARLSDLVWVVSEVERQALLAEDPGLRISVLSMIHEIPTRSAGYAERDGLGFVGGFRHAPNVDAVRFLVQDVFPRVRAARPDVSLAIVGADMPARIRALESPGIAMMGHVADLDPLLARWRVFVAPLRYGAGVKGKITQALSLGLPTVTTSQGAEGMGLRHGEDILIADTPAAFAATVLTLYESPQQWERLSRGGRTSIEERFSFAAATARMREDLARLGHLARPGGAASGTE
ncbi:MAG TPA: glycosyltransferase [Candidatus Binatia bacterium]|nr:glycosyltransferase [Candidatus Binatia bacterium]